jgi:hypothetical protein
MSPKKICKGLMSTWYKAPRKMQIKPTVKYHYIPTRMEKMKDPALAKCEQGREATELSTDCWFKWKTKNHFGKHFWLFLKNLNMHQPDDLAIWLLGIYPRETKHMLTQRLDSSIQSRSFGIAPNWKQSRCPKRWKNKQITVLAHNGILLSNKNEWTIGIHNNREKSQNNYNY